ncbi:MAG TPA: YrvL family regulatory protein [Chondromyces sp.]|nr:YrvL family regulatory protein [Chondromyces sp.]
MHVYCSNNFTCIYFFEIIFLKVLGLQYHSIGDLVFFFVMYIFLEIPLSLIANTIPKALQSVGIFQSNKGWLSFILNTSLVFALIELLDSFMDNVSITWQGSLLFALITGLIGWAFKEKDDEPPMIDSEEFQEIGRRFTSKK